MFYLRSYLDSVHFGFPFLKKVCQAGTTDRPISVPDRQKKKFLTDRRKTLLTDWQKTFLTDRKAFVTERERETDKCQRQTDKTAFLTDRKNVPDRQTKKHSWQRKNVSYWQKSVPDRQKSVPDTQTQKVPYWQKSIPDRETDKCSWKTDKCSWKTDRQVFLTDREMSVPDRQLDQRSWQTGREKSEEEVIFIQTGKILWNSPPSVFHNFFQVHSCWKRKITLQSSNYFCKLW